MPAVWGDCPEDSVSRRCLLCVSPVPALDQGRSPRISGTVSDFAATFYYLTKMPETTEWGHWRATLAEGLAESMSPSILGGTFLSLIALFMAVAAARIERKGL